MIGLLAKLGDPIDCTLCPPLEALIHSHVTVVPTATVSTAGREPEDVIAEVVALVTAAQAAR